jgi:hypothetical protein
VNHRERWFVAVCVVLSATVYLIYIFRTAFWNGSQLTGTLFDDALISLRYAQNLVAGHGLVWNPGEQPPIEGYSNLAWTLAMAAVALVTPTDLTPIGVSLVGALLLLGNGLAAWSILRGLGASPVHRGTGLVLVLTCYPLVFWTLRGMEVGLLSLLLLVACRLALDQTGRRSSSLTLFLISGAAGLALLTRNDSVLLFIPVLAYAAWRHDRFRLLAPVLVPLVLCAVAQVAFRYGYYHELAPNTYVLKMTGVPTGIRLAAGFRALVDTLPPIACAMILVAMVARWAAAPAPVRHVSLLACATVLIQWAYLVRIGGDAWVLDYSNRFIATVTPLLLVASIAALPTWVQWLRHSRRALPLLVTFMVALLVPLALDHPTTFAQGSYGMVLSAWMVFLAAVAWVWWLGHGTRAPFRPIAAAMAGSLFLAISAHGWMTWARFHAAKAPDDIAFARQALMLRKHLPSGAVIAAGWAGAPAYFSGLRTIDLLGKTDAHVARGPATLTFRPGHDKMDLDYSVGQLQPDVVLLDDADVARYGYRRLQNGIWLRQDSPVARGATDIASSWCVDPAESVYCPGPAVASR